MTTDDTERCRDCEAGVNQALRVLTNFWCPQHGLVGVDVAAELRRDNDRLTQALAAAEARAALAELQLIEGRWHPVGNHTVEEALNAVLNRAEAAEARERVLREALHALAIEAGGGIAAGAKAALDQQEAT